MKKTVYLGTHAKHRHFLVQSINEEGCSCKRYVALETYLFELELELIQTQMTQKPMLRAEVGMRLCCTNKASLG